MLNTLIWSYDKFLFIFDFLQDTLHIPNARENIKIDRSHRIGIYTANKTHPTVVKFNYYPNKLTVKEHVRQVTKDQDEPTFQVSDQLPRAVQEKPKNLSLLLLRLKGLIDHLGYLMIGKPYAVDTVSSTGYVAR